MKDSDKNRAVLAEVVAHAWRDPAYFGKLRQNPKLVLTEAGCVIPYDMEVVILENTSTLINAILPPKGQMAKYEARLQKAVAMLKDLPEDMAVHLHRDSATRTYIVIPEAPLHAGELTDAQLEQVVGGKGSSAPKHTSTPNPPPPQIIVGQVMSGSVSNPVTLTVMAVVTPCFIS